jgi:hypothetical protein
MIVMSGKWPLYPGTVTPSPPAPPPISGEGEKCRSDALNPEKEASAPLSQGWGRGPVARHPTNNSLFYHGLTNHPAICLFVFIKD